MRPHRVAYSIIPQPVKKELNMQARLTTKPEHEVVAAIQSLDLEPVKLRMMDAELGEGWTREYADSVGVAYKTYLTMLVKYPDDAEDILLSEDVDEFWHTHILQTRKYMQDCQNVFGNYLHHEPEIGMPTAAANLEKRAAQLEKTRKLYEREFAYCAASAKAEKAAYCAANAKGESAYCAASIATQNAAYCAASVKAEPAYCAASIEAKNAAYCAASVKAEPAYCAASIEAKNAAYCAASVKAEPAYCAASIEAKNAAYCAANVKASDAAYCAASIGQPRPAERAIA
jgi:hypothetical protein